MPLPNRVDPFKQLHAVPHRGKWFGNRGCLHDKNGRIKWFQMGKRWIVCELEFKGRKRKLLQPGRYTELFFMDEATALAAGHRPCNECRRPYAQQFLKLSGFKTLAELDNQLHTERMVTGPQVEDWRSLPNGVMIGWMSHAYLIHDAHLYRWSYTGYRPVESVEADIEKSGILDSAPFQHYDRKNIARDTCLCTPATTIEVLRHGYTPQIDLEK